MNLKNIYGVFFLILASQALSAASPALLPFQASGFKQVDGSYSGTTFKGTLTDGQPISPEAASDSASEGKISWLAATQPTVAAAQPAAPMSGSLRKPVAVEQEIAKAVVKTVEENIDWLGFAVGVISIIAVYGRWKMASGGAST